MQVRATKETHLWPKAEATGQARGALYKGQIWSVKEEVKGKAIAGNDRWYVDALGNFLWSGELELVETASQNATTARQRLPKPTIKPPNAKLPLYKMDWPIVKLDIDRLWPFSMGEGVKIAILDSGLYMGHAEINRNYVVAARNFIDGSTKVGDKIGHGTLCAGLIHAQGQRLFGVAPAANLLIGKVVDNQVVEENRLLEGIKWAIEQGAHIISVSLFRESGDMSQSFRDSVSQLIKDSGVLLLASVGNDGDLGFEVNHAPACIEGVIGIGSYDKDYKLDPDTTRTPHLDYFMPGRDVFSIGLKKHVYRRVSGTSMATAIASGLFSLLLSPMLHQNPDFKPQDLLPILDKTPKASLAFSPRQLASDSPKPIPDFMLAFQQTFSTHVHLT